MFFSLKWEKLTVLHCVRVYVCECVLACTTNAFALETNERLAGSGGVDPVSARRAEGRRSRLRDGAN